MKIKSLDIASFGKFKNYHLDLSDSLTVIFGENEKGKSTIMAFIRMMFYGNTGKASGIDKNPRKKYKPWGSDLMAGSVTFESEGVTYRLEREFRASNSTDKIALFNLDTGEKESVSGSEDIGAKFFGLTDGAFERSVFITEPTLGAKNEAADGEINARLSSLATTSEDDVSFEKIYLRIRNGKEALLSKSRKIGKLDRAEGEILDLGQKISEAKVAEESVVALKAEALEKEAEIKESSNAAGLLFEQLKNSDKIKKKNFLSRYISAEKERNAAREKLSLKGGGFADKAYIASIKSLADEISALREEQSDIISEREAKTAEVEALKQELANASPADKAQISALEEKRELTEQEITAKKAEIAELNKELESLTPTKKLNLPLLIIGLVVLCFGGVSFAVEIPFVTTLISAAVCGAGILLALLGLIIKVKVQPDSSEINARLNTASNTLSSLLRDKEALLDSISKVRSECSDYEIQIASKTALIKSKSDDTRALENELGGVTCDLDNAKAALSDKLQNLKYSEQTSITELVKGLEEVLGYYEMLSQKITVLADNAAVSSLNEAEEKLAVLGRDSSIADLSEAEIDSLKERFKAQSDHTSTLKAELASIKEKIKAVTASTPPVAVLERERYELQNKIKAYREYVEVSDLALTTLDEAFRDLRKNYSEVLDKRTAEIFTRLSDEKYLSVSISKSMEASFTTSDAFGTKEAPYLSRGTEDQLYLAMRLAIAELITNEGEKLPIFADDPLSQYDDGRTEKAFSFLKDYAKDKQIIMFTCHSFIKRVAEKLNIKTFDM